MQSLDRKFPAVARSSPAIWTFFAAAAGTPAVAIVIVFTVLTVLRFFPDFDIRRVTPKGDPTLSGVLAFVSAIVGLFVASAYVSFRCFVRAREARAFAAAHRVYPIVFYLRPFQSDSRATRRRFAEFLALLLSPIKTLMSDTSREVSTLEETMVETTRRLGSLVTVGSPRDRRPVPGARRFYVEDTDAWKRAVHELLGSARAVLVLADTSPNVQWEIGAALDSTPLDRVMILTERVAALRGIVRERFAAALSKRARTAIGSDLMKSAVICFDPRREAYGCDSLASAVDAFQRRSAPGSRTSQ